MDVDTRRNFNHSSMGHTVGHWEEDTLAVETAGFNELDRLGLALGGLAQKPSTNREAARHGAIPKARPGHLEVETTYDDPGAFKRPFKTRYVKSVASGEWGALEYVCAENSREEDLMRRITTAAALSLLPVSLCARLNYREPGVPRLEDGTVNLSAAAPRAAHDRPDLTGVWMHEPTPTDELKRLFRGIPGEGELDNLPCSAANA